MIPDEDAPLRWGLIATNIVSKGVSSFFQNFERKSFIIPNFFVTLQLKGR